MKMITKNRYICACLGTALLVGPLCGLLGFSLAARWKVESGRRFQRLISLQEFYTAIQTNLGYKVRWYPVDGDGNKFMASHRIKADLYEVKDSTIYVIETNGILTLATDE
jgi:hypothetical protein